MRVAFFDRDGVVNQDFGYVYQPENFIFMDGIFELLELFKRQNFLLLLVTNQSGIGMGYYTQRDFEFLSAWMQAEIKKQLGFGFDFIYFCPHRPDENCSCRKPKPGMIQKAMQDYPIHLHQSVLIGDKMRDVQAAQNAGVRYKILLSEERGGAGDIENLCRVQNLRQIPKLLTELFKEKGCDQRF